MRWPSDRDAVINRVTRYFGPLGTWCHIVRGAPRREAPRAVGAGHSKSAGLRPATEGVEEISCVWKVQEEFSYIFRAELGVSSREVRGLGASRSPSLRQATKVQLGE